MMLLFVVLLVGFAATHILLANPLLDFDQIVFDGGHGDDELIIVGTLDIPLYVSGGTGGDYLMGGHDTTYLFGGDGDDTLAAQGGYTVMTGGFGDDTFVFGDAWGEAIVNENTGGGNDTLDFSNVTADLNVNVRGTTSTADGANTARHLANTIEGFIAGQGASMLNLHRDNGGVLELGEGVLVWDGVEMRHEGFDSVDVRFVNSQNDQRTGVVRVLADQDYTGQEVRFEARSIDIRASITADGLSLRSDTIIGISQDLSVESGLGRLVVLEADEMRLEGKNGVGDVNMPLYIRAGVVEAATQGAAGIYLAHLGGGVIGDVEFEVEGGDNIGLSTGAGGNIHFFNLAGTLEINAEIQASGGNIVLATEEIEINDTVESSRGEFLGTLVLQPLSVNSGIDLAMEGAGSARFSLDSDELDRIIGGFDAVDGASYYRYGELVEFEGRAGITIGRPTGRHDFTIGTYVWRDTVTLRAPVLGGSFNVVGAIYLEPLDPDREAYLIFLGP